MNTKKYLYLAVVSLFLSSCGGYYFKRGKTVESEETGTGAPTTTGTRVPATVISFDLEILPLFTSACSDCHVNKAPTYDAAMKLITKGSPSASSLYTKAIGTGHEKIWDAASDEAKLLASWINSPSK